MHELLQPPCILFPSLTIHLLDDALEGGNHIYTLAKRVCQTYLKLRMHAATKSVSEYLTGTKIRHHLTRQIIWQRQ